MRKLFAIPVLLACLSAHAQSFFASNYNSGSVTVPAGATANLNMEQLSGWTGDSTFSVSGAFAPAVCEMTPTGVGNPCPGANTSAGGTYTGGGGGSTLNLLTVGSISGYSGWMAKVVFAIGAAQLHSKLVATFNINTGTISEVQAHEIGYRAANNAAITNNGQTQLVPLSSTGPLEFDIASGGSTWLDTGCRFSMFTLGATNTEEWYWVNDYNGAMSLIYVALNGVYCYIPPSLQHIAGASLGWSPNAGVLAFQPDAKPTSTAASFGEQITASMYTW